MSYIYLTRIVTDIFFNDENKQTKILHFGRCVVLVCVCGGGGGGVEVLTGFLFLFLPFYLKSFHINNSWTDLPIMKMTKKLCQ